MSIFYRSMKKKESSLHKSIAYYFGPRFKDDDDLRASTVDFDENDEDDTLMGFYPFLGDGKEKFIQNK